MFGILEIPNFEQEKQNTLRYDTFMLITLSYFEGEDDES